MKKEDIFETCPLCGGSGEIKSRMYKYTTAQRDEARKLYREGITLREIGRRLGIGEHPQKVKSMILAKKS